MSKWEPVEGRGGDARYVRRDNSGRFEESDDPGRRLSQSSKKTMARSAKTGRVDRALKRASERTGAFNKKY